jgi:site-specific DNA-cytosine methylase
VDHIHGSPPCQGFSRANRTGDKLDRANNDKSFGFVEAIRFFQPPTASMVNINGILDDREIEKARTKLDQSIKVVSSKPTKKGHYLQRVASELFEIGYQLRITMAVRSYFNWMQLE